jgi:uncharacterized protein with PIN domain
MESGAQAHKEHNLASQAHKIYLESKPFKYKKEIQAEMTVCKLCNKPLKRISLYSHNKSKKHLKQVFFENIV